MIDAEELYALTKARPAMLACVRNLRTASGRRYAMPARHARTGATVYVVGSGPSLAGSLDELRAAQARGALVYTTNTGLPALARAGIVPDAVVVREVLDVRSHLEHEAREFVFDLAVNSDVWRSKSDASWFVAGGTQFFELASRLGVRPLFGGPASLTAAVALAEARGADEITLIGVDLAFAPDGVGYAAGTAFEGYRGTLDGDAVTLDAGGLEAMKRASDAVGVPAPPAHQRTVEVPSLDGGTVRQLGTWHDQQAWLELFAMRSRTLLGNATRSGALIAGWDRGHSGSVVRGTSVRMGEPVPTTRAVLEDIARQARTVECLASTVRDPDGCVVAVPGYLDGCDVVEAAAAGDLITVRRMAYAPGPGVRLTCAALASAAEAVRAAVDCVDQPLPG